MNESPGVQVDLVYRCKLDLFGADFRLGLAARNLTGTGREEYQLSDVTDDGRTEFDTYKRGRSLSASLTAEF